MIYPAENVDMSTCVGSGGGPFAWTYNGNRDSPGRDVGSKEFQLGRGPP
jgi:hypothetical protein